MIRHDCAKEVAAAVREARKAAFEEAAAVVDQCNREGPYNAIGAASRIRALAQQEQASVV